MLTLSTSIFSLLLLAQVEAAPSGADLLGVDVFIESPAQLEQLQAAEFQFIGERIGFGPMPFALAPEQVVELGEQAFELDIWSTDLGARLAAERTRVRAAARRRSSTGADFFEDYRGVEDYYDYIDELAELAPEVVELHRIGSSVQSRGLSLLRLSSDLSRKKPALLVLGLAHAREWISGMSVMYLADQLLRTRAEDPLVARLLNEVEIHIVPVLNPDGYSYAWDIERFWRKNRGAGGDGVDLNRNWGFGWGGVGASDNPASETYHGPKAFSEPETTAVRDWVQEHGMVLGVIDVHAYANYIVFPNGCLPDPVPNQEGHAQLAQVTAAAMTEVHGERYVPKNAFNWYPACGASDDYFANENIWALTFELRGNSFVLPQEELRPAIEETYVGLLRAFRWVVDDEWDDSTGSSTETSGGDEADTSSTDEESDSTEAGTTGADQTGDGDSDGDGSSGTSGMSGSSTDSSGGGEGSDGSEHGSSSSTGGTTGGGQDSSSTGSLTSSGSEAGSSSGSTTAALDGTGNTSEAGDDADDDDGSCRLSAADRGWAQGWWRLLLPR